MREEVMNALPKLLKEHITTLKKASADGSNKAYMCESKMEIIDFDKIPNEYARGKGWNGVPKSNDALYIDVQGKWYFIEFKNGTIAKDDIYRKIYDSLIMLIEEGVIPNFDFVRENINYILVYNEEKDDKVPNSADRDRNYAYLMRLAEQEEKLYGIEKFEKYLFRETHTYTKNQFKEKFINRMEQEENIK